MGVQAVVVGLEELAEFLPLDVATVLVNVENVVDDETVFLKELLIERRH